MTPTKIGIVVLVHNATSYVEKCIRSIITHTTDIDYSLIVVDNNSNILTKKLLADYYINGIIDILCSLESNRFFSKANNIGAQIVPENCSHILLLNSDVEILNSQWLYNLIKIHSKGITSYGAVINTVIDSCNIPDRADGYCFLIDKELYLKLLLDETFPWFWSITKLQALILNEGYAVKAIRNHAEYIHHYGGRSGDALKYLPKSLEIDPKVILSWFQNKKIQVL